MTWKRRYYVVMGMFLLSLLLYIDRICISVAKDPISSELALSDKAMGWVLSAFALGYALLQVPSGMMADHLGPRRVLASIVTFWSLLTALTGAAWNYFSLLVVRFLFGAGEAGAFPGMSRAIYSWIPLRERGMVIGLNFSGSRLGAAFALPLVALMIEAVGWRTSFAILGAVGLIWALLWWRYFRDDPQEMEVYPELELQEILVNRQDAPEVSEPLERKKWLRSPNMWVAVGQYFCSNFTFFFALTWLFPHLKSTYQLDSVEAGWYAVAPFIAGAVGNWVAGGWIDRIFRRGRWDLSRRLPAMVGFALAAFGMFASLHMDSAGMAVLMLSIAIFGADMTLPPSWSFCVDIGKAHAGTISGTMNMAGNVGSFLTALAFPYLMDWTGSVNYFFYLAALLNVFALLLWTRARPSQGL